MAGIETVHIPTKGGNVAILELMCERIDFLLEAPQLMMPYIKSNKLRGIATTAKTRSKIYNDLPTIAEALPGYEVSSYIGIAATGGTPEPIIQALYQGVKKSIENKDVAKRLVDLGGEPTHTTPAETKLFVENELDKWRKVINLRKIERQ
jgi:tripartite-type tricarboxylate transporter receptor subunit TctC